MENVQKKKIILIGGENRGNSYTKISAFSNAMIIT